MQRKDGNTTRKVRELYRNTAIKTSRTQQGGIEGVWPVGCRKHNNALVIVKAIHLGKELVEGLLALVVGGKTGVTTLTNGVYLIDKDDAGSLFIGLFKEVTDLSGTASNKHLHKFRARDGKERNVCLARNRFSKQGFARSWRAYQQSTVGKLCANSRIFTRVFQEAYDLRKRFLGLILASNIFKRNSGFLAINHLGTRFTQTAAKGAASKGIAAKGHGVISTHCLFELTIKPNTCSNHKNERQDGGNKVVDDKRLGIIGLRGGRILDALPVKGFYQ